MLLKHSQLKHLLLSAVIPWGMTITSNAQSSGASPSLVAESERAVVRSQEDLKKAQALMRKAREAQADGKLKEAYQIATDSIALAPSGSAASSARAALISSYTSISLAYARQLASNGVFTDSIAEQNGIRNDQGLPLSAESVAKSILAPSVNPGNRDAKQLLADLEQPEVLNKTVTPKFAAQRDDVIKLLQEASGYAQSGRNDLALKTYDAVLRIDPYNNAARKGMEAIQNSKIKYADEAYNETRSRLLWQVEKSWERPPRKAKEGRSTESTGRQQDIRGTDQIVAKLNSIIIPKIDLNDTPVSEAIEYLKQKSVEQDPAKKGVNLFLKLGQALPVPQSPAGTSTNATVPVAPMTPESEPHVSLNLTQVPLYVALDYIAKLSNMKLKIDTYAVSMVPLSEPTDILVTKEYQVPPTFIPPKPLDSTGTLPQPGASGVPDPNKARVAQRMDAKEYLASQGVEFPIGASANYLSAGSKLVVRNTRDNIDLIDSLVDAAMGVAPSQVDIQTKFLEINQNNLQELGFDWLLGPFSIGGGVYGSGGGNNARDASGVWPFGNPYPGSAAMSPVGNLRSGSAAITGNSVDALIASGGVDAFTTAQGDSRAATTPAPGIFSIAGIFTDTQFQVVIRALNQKKGVDLMSAPKVTTKSGVKATVKVISEFIYPKAYDPPQIPQSVGQNGGGGGNGGGGPPVKAIVTPSFPRDFTKQDLGVTLEATPKIGPDGYTIDLELHPQVVDFDGFINYGSPITQVGYTPTLTDPLVSEPVAQLQSSNTINQPVFSFREVNTFVTVWDGQTIALGGLIREDVQKTQDKVPFLGDVPLAGRLFRSEADQKIKKNLVIFVTPRILNAEGQPRRDEVEEPEIVTPIGLPQDLPQPSLSSPTVRSK